MTVDDSMKTPPGEGEDEKRRRFLPLWLFLLLFIVILVLVLSRCGRDRSSEVTESAGASSTTEQTTPATETTAAASTTASTAASTTEPVAPLDVSGEWSFSIDVTETSGVCSGEEEETVVPESVTISQDGDSLTVTGLNAGYPPWTGAISGATVTFGGSRDEDQGTTQASFTLTFDAATGTFTGTESWSWEGGGQSCPTGASEVTAVRSP